MHSAGRRGGGGVAAVVGVDARVFHFPDQLRHVDEKGGRRGDGERPRPCQRVSRAATRGRDDDEDDDGLVFPISG